MTAQQKEIIVALAECTMLPGSFDKKISQDWYKMANENPPRPMSDKGWNYARYMLHKYRKQLGAVYEKHKELARTLN